MSKIIVTIGVSTSGKTTWAKQYAKENKAYIVSLDTERETLFGEYRMGDAREEDLIKEIVKHKVTTMLRRGDVVIDATYLRREYLDNIIKNYPNTKIEFKVFGEGLTKVDIIKRNQNRFLETGKLIPESVIHKQIKLFDELEVPEDVVVPSGKVDPRITKMLKNDSNLPSCFVFDLDGTIALMNGRNPYAGQECETDVPDMILVEIMRLLAYAGAYIIIFSGRNSDKGGREATEAWLKKHDIPFDILAMRKEKDFRSDVKIKNEMYEEYIEGKLHPVAAFDDRDCMVDYYRNKGIQTYQCYYGNF